MFIIRIFKIILVAATLVVSFVGLDFEAQSAWAQESKRKAAARNYPGAQDEEELKIQSEISRPGVVVDRKSIEQRVLRSFLKKDDPADKPSKEQNTEQKTE